MNSPSSNWAVDQEVLRVMLRDRKQRRRWLAGSLVLVLVQLVLGLWVIDGWLAKDLFWFTFWWVGCMVAALWLMCFALYDALRVIREERAAARKSEHEA